MAIASAHPYHFQKAMTTLASPLLKVIGVGNAWRGDDAAGLLVARRLREENLPQVEVSENSGTISEVQEALQDARGVIVVDAVVTGGPPGAIYRFDAHGDRMPVELSRSSSSHGYGVAEALALGRLFQELPPFLIIYGIEGKNFAPGQEVSPEVAATIPEAVRRIKQEIEEWRGRKGILGEGAKDKSPCPLP
jgi:hydrogenase maturation protease